MFKTDVYFIHAPSVYDFRKRPALFGPISDVVPSSPTFEMYPIGITSIAEYLEQKGYNVQIINLAYLMLKDKDFDVEKLLKKLKPKAFALDLHWLPHCHGSIEVTKILKKFHPDIPIIMGGLSASYYHEELINYPSVDFVVRGDSTEYVMYRLLKAIIQGGNYYPIPNLTWRDSNGKSHINELTYVPDNIDDIDVPSYRYVIRSVLKYKKLHNFVPYLGWLQYPNTALLTARGCTINCAICGGAKYSYKKICHRSKPAFRSPETLIKDIRYIKSFSRAPIFVIHDIRQGGDDYWNTFLDLLAKENIENELVFELFKPADHEFFAKINKTVKKYSLEMTLESHDENIRKVNGKFRCTNQEVESTLEAALNNGCRKIDIFFMIGIPHQTYDNALGSIDYCRYLLDKFNKDKRLSLFTAPLAPFLDPGSLAFENPEKFGYIKHCNTLEDHRQALLNLSWQDILSYETTSMNRQEIVKATYKAAELLNQLKFDYKLISSEVYKSVKHKIYLATTILEELNSIKVLSKDEQEKELKKLETLIVNSNRHSICGNDELKWPIHKRFTNIFRLSKIVFKTMFEISQLEFLQIKNLIRKISPRLTQEPLLKSDKKSAHR